MPRAPSTFLSHGGGPMPLLGQNPVLAKFLAGWPATLAQPPTALIVISAHWEETVPSVTGAESPPLIYDYGGFPPETYKYTYNAPGDPALAARISALIDSAGLGPARVSSDRGWDHGVFVPMMLAFPAADIPIVALSLVSGYDPAMHWQIGRALRPLRDEGVAIVGSGSSCTYTAICSPDRLPRCTQSRARAHSSFILSQRSQAHPWQASSMRILICRALDSSD
jgi:aromatic ring-opening dioxygenase catalytic subunit (LigB family)